MMARLRDSGLDGLKAEMHYCQECRKTTVHYKAPGGWPICHACGYNAELEKLADMIDQRQAEKSRRIRWPWER
jgi:ribosomal protein L37AE/L43A